MSVKIRLVRFGRKKRPFYRIVVVDSRKKRDGAYIEKVGHYNPLPDPPDVAFDEEKVLKWLNNGAIPTDTVTNLLTKAGILLKRNLMRRNLPPEQIDIEMQKWAMAQEEKRARKKTLKTPEPVPETPAAPPAGETPEQIFVAEETKAEKEAVVETPEEMPAAAKEVEPPAKEEAAPEPEEKLPVVEPEPKPVKEKPAKAKKSEKPAEGPAAEKPKATKKTKEKGETDTPAK